MISKQNVKFMRRLTFLLTCLFLIGLGVVNAQSKTVSGKVVSAEDGQPIIGATVIAKGTTTGVTTNVNGQFSFTVPSTTALLVVSYVGMKTQEVSATTGQVVKLGLNENVLDEVMVVAFGTSKRTAFTGAATVVNSDDISKHVASNVANTLVGSVPGLQIRSASGAPGSSDGKINIRGISSLYAGTDPLIIVDGAPYAASLTNIPPNDIESVSVLSDAASAALYGARGASGVIIVTTKKTKSQEAVISVDIKTGVNTRSVQDYNTIKDAAGFYESYYAQQFNRNYFGLGQTLVNANKNANTKLLNDLGYNVYSLPAGELLVGTDGKLNPNATIGRKFTGVDGKTYYLTPDNWQDLSYHSASRKEYNIGINGGTNKSSFYTSVGYLDEDGIIESSSYNRLSARIKADYQAKKWLKVGATANYVHSYQEANPNLSNDELGQTNLMYFSSMIAPIYPVYLRTLDDSGKPVIMTDDKGRNVYDYGIANTNGGLVRAFLAPGNPLGANRFNQVHTKGDQLNGTLSADVTFTDYLKFNTTNTLIWGQTQYSDYGSSLVLPKSSVGGELYKSVTNNVRQNFLQTLTFFKKFDRHNINAMIGHEYYLSEGTGINATAYGAFSENIQELNAFATKSDAHSNSTSYNVEGYFMSLQYDYLDKYYGSASYRRDASSNFAKENRWGNFWSVGGAWIISKENFMNNTSSWLDMLKIKVSIGQQGNDQIGSYSYIDTYNISKATDTSMSATFRQVGNPSITWETTTSLNTGLEFSLWRGRLSGGVDVYSKKVSNLLFWLSIPESMGSRGYYGNIGDMSNAGVEFKLNGEIVKTRLVDWSLTFNASHNESKILKLPESKIKDNGGFIESNYWYEEGGPMYNYMTYSYAGVNDKGQALYYYDEDLSPLGNATTNNTSKAGKKHSGTTTEIGNASRYAQGSNLPKVFGGIGTSLRVGNFDASLSFDYQIGGKVYDSRYQVLMTPTVGSANGYTFHEDWKRAWSPNNTFSTIPRWQAEDKYAAASSNRWLTNASYLNFQSFNLGYTLPKNLIKEFTSIRIYAAGENLSFWSARKGLDPRYAFGKTESLNVYSPVRNVSVGIQVTL